MQINKYYQYATVRHLGVFASFIGLAPTVTLATFINFNDIHQPNRIPTAGDYNHPNLLQDGGFEQDGSWLTTCGAPDYAGNQTTEGTRALKISSALFTAQRNCKPDSLGFGHYIITQSGINLNRNENNYTLSFDVYFNQVNNSHLVDQAFTAYIGDSTIAMTMPGARLKMTSGWHKMYFIFNRAVMESQLPAGKQLDWSNLSLWLKLDGIHAQNHEVYLDNVRLSSGSIDDYNLSPLPADLRNSQERMLVKGTVAGSQYYGTMTVGGKAVKLYQDLQTSLYSKPSSLGQDIIVGHKYLTHWQGSVPPNATSFPMFSVAVQRWNTTGQQSAGSPIYTFLGKAGLLDSATRNNLQKGQGYDFNGARVSTKHNRAIFSSCVGRYFDAAQIESNSIYCGGVLTDGQFKAIKNAQGQLITLDKTEFSIGTSGLITGSGLSLGNSSTSSPQNIIHFYDLQGKKIGDMYTDGNLNSQAWANHTAQLAVLTDNGAGKHQLPGNNQAQNIPLITIYAHQGADINIKYRYAMPLSTFNIVGWAANDKYILFTRKSANGTESAIWWLEVATGKRGQITTEMPVTGYDMMSKDSTPPHNQIVFSDSFE